jgi:hypothetical protein
MRSATNTPLKQGVNEITVNIGVSDFYSPAQKLRCARLAGVVPASLTGNRTKQKILAVETPA